MVKYIILICGCIGAYFFNSLSKRSPVLCWRGNIGACMLHHCI